MTPTPVVKKTNKSKQPTKVKRKKQPAKVKPIAQVVIHIDQILALTLMSYMVAALQ